MSRILLSIDKVADVSASGAFSLPATALTGRRGVVQTGPERDYTICADVRGLDQLTEVLRVENLVSSRVDTSKVVLCMPIFVPQDGGLPSRRYYYRFWYNNYKSCTGITKTTTHGALESLVFGMTSCANWGESALF